MSLSRYSLLSNFQTNDFAKVERQCLSILEKDPNDYVTLMMLSEAIWRSGEYDGAVPYALRALEIHPKSFRPLCVVARSYAESGAHDRAHEFAKRILEAKPTRSVHLVIKSVLWPLKWIPQFRRVRSNSEDQLRYFDDWRRWAKDYVESFSASENRAVAL